MSILFIEPFYGGSHAQLLDLLKHEYSYSVSYTLPAKKWHWRARSSALYFSEIIEKDHQFRKLFCSSTLNLAELVALRRDLEPLEKIVYFHENQLVYPIQEQKDRDFQYGYNQILSCLVADKVIFNSKYNRDSFLSALKSYFSISPKDQRPNDDIAEKIKRKSIVIYYPIRFPVLEPISDQILQSETVLHIVWPHRWEHDKNPELLYSVLISLKASGCQFRISLLGEQYEEKPDSLIKLQEDLQDHLYHSGYLPSKDDYYRFLQNVHVALSTATHEFFGVAMLEAIYCGCYPMCPNRLVYPEIVPKTCLYNTEKQLIKRLQYFCQRPSEARKARKDLCDFHLDQYSWSKLRDQYNRLLC